jgi:hypothetical protein
LLLSLQSGNEQLAVQILNSATKWLLNTCDDERDPFQRLNEKSKDEAAGSINNNSKLPSIKQEFSARIPKEDLYEFDAQGSTSCFTVAPTPSQVRELVANKPFLARFTVGWIFANLVYHAIPLLGSNLLSYTVLLLILILSEKYKQLADGILYYRVLLSSWYIPGRRGKWYNRLAINLEHLGRKVDKKELEECSSSKECVCVLK